MSPRRAALFDMDRTLLRVETVTLYVKHQRKLGEATWRDAVKAAYWVGKYTLGMLDAPRVAEKVLVALEGFPENALAARCDDWFRQDIEEHIADAGREAVARHQRAGDLCAIVTAASPYAARPLARRLGIDHVVSSVFEVGPDGRFTGRPEHPICIGDGKRARAEQLAAELGIALCDATFYSDSIQDLALFEVVGEPVAVNPDPRLRRLAARRGWRVERW